MALTAEVKAKVDQLAAGAPLSNGDMEYLRMSKMGDLFTADWQTKLAMAGVAYTVDLGTINSASAVVPVTGNAGADLDQPELVIALDSGWLVPMYIQIGIQDDADAYDDEVEVLFIADRSQATAAGATGTSETPLNMLDGGDAFSGRCFSILTGNITDPVPSDILYYNIWELTRVASESAGSGIPNISIDYRWPVPRFLAGPCTIVAYIVGTVAPSIMGSVAFAEIPSSWITVS